MAEAESGGAGWSAAWGVAAAVAGGIGGTLWNTVATTGPRILILPACALSVIALASLYLCFAVLGGWWPTRRPLSGAAMFTVPPLVIGERREQAPVPCSAEAAEIPPPLGGLDPAMAGGPLVAGDVPQQPPGFQPRTELLAELEAAGPGVSVVHAVTGMRGVGKTQLAAAYARVRLADRWRLVAWINAEDNAGLLAGLTAVAEAAGLAGHGGGDPGRAVRHWLEADGDHRLIVFDNVTDADALRPYVPAGGAATVLITSNRQSAANLGTSVGVKVFSPEEALAFLTDRTGLADPTGAGAVAAELGYLPLALAQAAAVIAGQHLSYRTYLERLMALPVEEYLIPQPGQPYPHGVAEAVLLSLNAVQASDRPDVCTRVLEMISVLSAAGVHRGLIYAAGQAGVLGSGEPGVGVDASAADRALGQLVERSLLTFSVDGLAIVAHRLVSRVVRDNLARRGHLAEVWRATASVLDTSALALLGSGTVRRSEISLSSWWLCWATRPRS